MARAVLAPSLEKALDSGVHALSIQDLLPIIKVFNESDVDHLLAACENRQRDLLSLSHELVLRFAKEYFDLQQRMELGSQGKVRGPKEDAALKLQSCVRRFLALRRFQKRLLATVFEEPSTPTHCSGGPASWLQRGLPGGGTGPEKGIQMTAQVRSVRAVRSSVMNITGRLWQVGLDMAAAYRCADVNYPTSVGHISIGQFLTLLASRLSIGEKKVLRQQGEIPLLRRLLENVGTPKLVQESLAVQATPALAASQPGRLPSPASLGDGLQGQGLAKSVDVGQVGQVLGARVLGSLSQTAHQGLLAYQQAEELDIAFPPPGNLSGAAARAGSEAGKTALLALRDSVAALGDVSLSWGKKKPSWRRLLLDAHVSLLLEEQTRLEQLHDSAQRSGKTIAVQLKNQLAICGSQISAARKRGASPRVAAPVFIARLLLLGERLKLAPVTVHAAVIMASEVSEERRTAKVKAKTTSEQVVAFSMPLPAPPQLLHLTALKTNQGVLCRVSLENLSESGMVLRVAPTEERKNTDWSANLRLHYCAGAASGTIRIGPLGRDGVEVKFVPRLLRRPGFVHVESFEQAERRIDPQLGSQAVSYEEMVREHADEGRQKGRAYWETLQELRFVSKRPNASGFTLGMPAAQAGVCGSIPVWYEAVFIETTVSAAKLQSLEELEELSGDAEEDAKELASLLEKYEQPMHQHLALDSDLYEADDREGDDDEDDEETDDEVENLKTEMNILAKGHLQKLSEQEGPVSSLAFTPAGKASGNPAAPATAPKASFAPAPNAAGRLEGILTAHDPPPGSTSTAHDALAVDIVASPMSEQALQAATIDSGPGNIPVVRDATAPVPPPSQDTTQFPTLPHGHPQALLQHPQFPAAATPAASSGSAAVDPMPPTTISGSPAAVDSAIAQDATVFHNLPAHQASAVGLMASSTSGPSTAPVLAASPPVVPGAPGVPSITQDPAALPATREPAAAPAVPSLEASATATHGYNPSAEAKPPPVIQPPPLPPPSQPPLPPPSQEPPPAAPPAPPAAPPE